MYWWLFLFCPLAYLLGGVNFSKTITRARHVDLTNVGSGNAGATNVGRAMGFKWFLLIIILEALKCATICVVGYLFCSMQTGVYDTFTEAHYIIILAMGLAAVIGAVFPVWYRFKGGKGIATWIGLGFCLNPLIMCAAGLIFTPLLALTKLMSVSTILGVIFWVVMSLIFEAPTTAPVITLYCCFIALILFSHRKNIVRIFTGTEKKLTFKRSDKTQK